MPLFRLKIPRTTYGTLLLGGVLVLSGCDFPSANSAPDRGRTRQASGEMALVNVAIARPGSVQEEVAYTGTTRPFREVSLRSRINAQLLSLSVDVGDRVSQGQLLGQLDSKVQAATVAQARAEAAAREAEVADALVQVADGEAQINRTKAELEQMESNLRRLAFLVQQGAVPEQQVEQARTAVSTAQATLRSAQEQLRSRQQRVIVARERVRVQQAIVAQQQEQEAFTELISPVTGTVLAKSAEPGNFVQSGDEVVRLGDFRQIKVAVQISELELGNIRPGQRVQVRFDAFPQEEREGQVSRISPAADPVARLVPIEVTLPNLQQRIGSGLLARVAFKQHSSGNRVVVPEMALQSYQKTDSKQPRKTEGGKNDRLLGQSVPQRNLPQDIGTIFTVEEVGKTTKVTARQVTLGKRGDGQVEIIAGLAAGDRYVTRSSKALKNGDPVRLSILSEQGKSKKG